MSNRKVHYLSWTQLKVIKTRHRKKPTIVDVKIRTKRNLCGDAFTDVTQELLASLLGIFLYSPPLFWIATADVLQSAEYPFLYLKAADFPSPVEAGHARCKMHQMDGTQFGG